MSTWGAKYNNVDSDFLEGITLFGKMNESIYGKIKNIFNDIFSNEEQHNFALPKVITIGNESTGKSSLLENITKCKLFPRERGQCTKCPIYVKLSNGSKKYVVSYIENKKKVDIQVDDKTKIHDIVKDFMLKMPDDYISTDEIVINITDVDMPTFDFLDLPGIREYPKKTADASKKLCKKYLKDRNAIVLCVAPATETRLTAQKSIAIIKEMNMESNCILALTMVDKLQIEDVEDLLINRIVGKSDELKGLNFAGHVAVVNRTNIDAYTLKDLENREKSWFKDNIIDCIPASHEQYREQIINNVSIANLIDRMDNLYSNFIKTKWKPVIMKDIGKKLDKLNERYLELGSLTIDPERLNKKIMSKIRHIYNDYKLCEDNDMDEEDEEVDEEVDEEDIEKAEKFNKCNSYMLSLCDSTIWNDEYISMLCKKIEKIFDAKSKYKLDRFEKVKEDIINRVKINIKNYRDEEGEHIIKICKSELLNKFIANQSSNCYNTYIRNIINKLFKILILYPSIIFDLKYTKDDYIEGEKYHNMRNEILQKIAKMEKYSNKIIHICKEVTNDKIIKEITENKIIDKEVTYDEIINKNHDNLVDKNILDINIMKIMADESIPNGYKLITVVEALENINILKKKLGMWDIAQLEHPYLINGNGYGNKIYETDEDDYANKGHKIIFKILK